ncbi:MAG TPA: DUF4328 domain-containing protein [Pseudonocardiaceae bacterium]|jgi:hypothetical protein
MFTVGAYPFWGIFVTEEHFHFRPFSTDERGGGEGEYFRPVRGLGIAATILLPLVCVAELFVNRQEWQTAGLIADVRNGAVSSSMALGVSALSLRSSSGLSLLALVAAGIVFLLWLWRARLNAELTAGPESQRRGRGWTIGGWICPVVNLWFPYQIVRDVYAASARRPVRAPLVGVWWAVLVANVVIANVVVRFITSTDPVQEAHTLATLGTVSLILEAVAAALIVVIIQQVTNGQERTPGV